MVKVALKKTNAMRSHVPAMPSWKSMPLQSRFDMNSLCLGTHCTRECMMRLPVSASMLCSLRDMVVCSRRFPDWEFDSRIIRKGCVAALRCAEVVDCRVRRAQEDCNCIFRKMP